jgi:CheY-like chemotaxis protein
MLVVDDNTTNRRILRLLGTTWGLRVDDVADARSALALLRSAAEAGHPYELALVDFQMPEMDGLALTRAVRADPALAGMRLVLLSSIATRAAIEAQPEHGLDACLTKPVAEAKLQACLRAVLGKDSRVEGPHAALPRSGAGRVVTTTTLAESEANARPRVLLVEDNEVNQRVSALMLERAGCAVDVAGNGFEALAAYENADYRLVFMDCQMPHMDGFEATRRLREDERRSGAHVPVIALTANAMPGDPERCLAAGMDDYLSKPMRLADLKRVITRWLAVSADAPRGL